MQRRMPARLRSRALALWGACLLAWALFLALVIVPAARTPSTDGFAAYYTDARVLLEDHRDLPRVYDDIWFNRQIGRFFDPRVHDVIHGQSPAMSLILAPIAWLPPAVARAIWIGLSVVLWVAGLALLIGALTIRARVAPALVVVSAATTVYTPLIDNLRRGQAYVLLFFLLCLVLRSVLREPERGQWRGGISLGVMMLVKGVGLWIWLLLAAARQKRLLVAATLTLCLGAAIASPLIGWEPWRTYLLQYRWMRGDPYLHLTAYQTVASLIGHLLVLTPITNTAPIADRPNLALLLILGITAGAFVRTVRLQRLDSHEQEDRALTLALFVALMQSVAPVAEGYHYVLVLPAIVIAFWWTTREPHRRHWRWSLFACVALICTPQALYGSPPVQGGWLALLAYPRLYGAFGLWVWLGRALEPRASPRSVARDNSGPAGKTPADFVAPFAKANG
jgi:hypothetical protein